MQALHDIGHPEVKPTARLIRRLYWWPRLHHDVAAYIARCRTCATAKTRTWQRAGPSFPLPIATDVWQDVDIDFIVNLPASETEKFTQIATIIHRRLGELQLIPCHDTMNAAAFADLFLNHV